MLPDFLQPETEFTRSGTGNSFYLGERLPGQIRIILGITRIVEQQSIELALESSSDGNEWSKEPLLTFPLKFYCGTYPMVLDLSAHPDTRYLRPRWTLTRWGRGDLTPMFGLYVYAEAVAAERNARFAVV